MSDTTQGMNVGYVAKLACIDLTSEEKVLFQSQLDQVLAYVEQLEELDVRDVAPTAHAIPISNVLREDTCAASLDHQAVVENAPAARDGLVLVPKIIDQ